MFRSLLVAGLLISGTALAAPDVRTAPGGVLGQAPIHFDGTDGGGVPVIHRPELPASAAVSNGVGRLATTGDDRTITYSGPGRGSYGSSSAQGTVINDNGRPVMIYPN